jgi:GH18 family chitinase
MFKHYHDDITNMSLTCLMSNFIDLLLSDNKLTHQYHTHVHIYKIKGNTLKLESKNWNTLFLLLIVIYNVYILVRFHMGVGGWSI